ncbi:hypothetical protein L1987_24305 [Smallanthus sonchifolius]|uniref:Uncharacterized protein n=1 Tax=Smallanthus sonchifolius TaxID=185202 RepID=A0ACB9IKN8_9ASTR|nr:hypothetical protein L1987_24305 [Smallanthus sonchifolius]
MLFCSARNLRGLRIAARLGLSFSKDVEAAIHKHASSVLTLGAFRIMMEMNYMLSYGAAESSLRLLHRFHILEILLQFQAAYISRQTTGSEQCTTMLMSWEDGLKFARKCGQPLVSFDPETTDPYKFISDDEVAKKVKYLAMRVIDSIDTLVDTDTLQNTMSIFHGSPCSGIYFQEICTSQLFHVLSHKVETYSKGRSSFEMNHRLLGKGDASETRFALGKIIINTMGCGIDNHPAPPENMHVTPSDSSLQKLNAKSSSTKKPKIEVRVASSCPKIEGPTMEKPEEISASQQPPQKLSDGKKQNAATEKPSEDIAATFSPITQSRNQKRCVSNSPIQELIATLETIIEDEDLPSQSEAQNPKEKVNVVAEVQVDHSTTKEQSVDKKYKRKQVLPLSSLFK